jgi:hypothetical protein
MYPISDDFKDTLQRSHTSIQRAEILIEGEDPLVLDIIDGYVTIDFESEIRRRCRLTLVDPSEDQELIPRRMGELLSPGHNEIKAYRGLQYWPGEAVGDALVLEQDLEEGSLHFVDVDNGTLGLLF